MLDLIRRVRDQGLGVVLITHTLPDALEVADRVEVLRFGRRSAHFERADATIELLVAAITGAYSNVTIPEVTDDDRPVVDTCRPPRRDPPAPIDETACSAVVDPDDDHPGRRGCAAASGRSGGATRWWCSPSRWPSSRSPLAIASSPEPT